MVISRRGMVSHNSQYVSPDDIAFSFRTITLIKRSNTIKAPDVELLF
ncbi:MAG: hypothetical protein KBF82_09350 [Chitinophagaceae bacterium]|nr:hypothetical protein [Chitinophagaceae bacterium]MBP9104056.1 hypothetical protein [Chitinophagaceae bacterium]